MQITLPDQIVAMIWDAYLDKYGLDAYIEARYSPAKTLLFDEELFEVLIAG
jgi:hypothetical protein